MGIFKKIWSWLSQDATKSFQKSDEEFMLKSTTYNTGGYIEDVKKYVGYIEASEIKREADEHFRQQQARRDYDDNFLMRAMLGYVIADSLKDSPSARNVEETKSSNYESSYTPSSSSSYDSGSYSSSCDSGSSSFSCDSGGC